MKAVILSAGQGSRLLPLTENTPKCLLPVAGQSILARQVRTLAAVGIDEIAVVTGFCAGTVEHALAEVKTGRCTLRTVFNPFYNVADNLASCWMARQEMDCEFLLLNGDTLFEPAVAQRLLAAPAAPVTLAIDRKPRYDSDDMKVELDGVRLLAVGKTLPEERVDGESIGLMRFQGQGSKPFEAVLDQMMRTPNGLNQWYLKAIGVLAEQNLVRICSIEGLRWCEIDFPHDLERASALFAEPANQRWERRIRRGART
jgi:choline kinase